MMSADGTQRDGDENMMSVGQFANELMSPEGDVETALGHAEWPNPADSLPSQEFAALGHIQSSPDLQPEPSSAENRDLIMDLPVTMKVVLGCATMPVATLSKLARGSIVRLDKKVGDPVDILVNGRLVARGEVVVLDEASSRFGVTLTQVGGLSNTTK